MVFRWLPEGMSTAAARGTPPDLGAFSHTGRVVAVIVGLGPIQASQYMIIILAIIVLYIKSVISLINLCYIKTVCVGECVLPNQSVFPPLHATRPRIPKQIVDNSEQVRHS